jgi:hypothetical protein
MKMKQTLLGGLSLLLIGCSQNNNDFKSFKTQENGYFQGNHILQAYDIVNRNFGGILEVGALDFDLDGMVDSYILTKTGPNETPVVFHTSSKRLLDGKDSQGERLWTMNSIDELNYRKN